MQNTTEASGRFELQVIEVQNPRSETRSGACCGATSTDPGQDDIEISHCLTPCQTVVSLCLKEYQSASPENSKRKGSANNQEVQEVDQQEPLTRKGCTYGVDTTSVLGPSSFTLSQPPPSGHMKLPFTFSWTVSTLIILKLVSNSLIFLIPNEGKFYFNSILLCL